MFNLTEDKEVDIFYASGVYDNYICNKYGGLKYPSEFDTDEEFNIYKGFIYFLI